MGAFAVYFYTVNRQQGQGLKVLEGVVSTFYQYPVDWVILLMNEIQKSGFRYTY